YRLTDLRFGQADIGRIDKAAGVDVANDQFHWDAYVTSVHPVIHIEQRNYESLHICNVSEVNCRLRPSRATRAGHATCAGSHSCTTERNVAGKGENDLVIVVHS